MLMFVDLMFKFRSLASFLTGKDVPLLLQGKVCDAYDRVVCYTEAGFHLGLEKGVMLPLMCVKKG